MIEPNVNDFFRAYATAMLVWQHVESALFSTFFSLYNYEEEPKIGSRNLKRLGAVFYSQETFSAKLKIVDALAKVTLAPELLTEWKKLKKQMERAYAHRNVLAHFTAVATNTESTALDLAMAPPMFVPEEIRRKRDRLFDAAGCEKLINDFGMIAGLLDEFSQLKVARGRAT